jgi:UDP-GlcNAc:undecaprenyl-phosphate/decaprenyl-phosphate GlcNAc-1-phosphate transferase
MQNDYIYFSICVILVFFSRWFAKKRNFFDTPDGKLKRHKKTVPYFGGFVFFITMFFFLLPLYEISYFYVLFSMMAISLVGLMDDRYSIPYKPRLIAQMLFTTIITYILIEYTYENLSNLYFVSIMIFFIFFGIATINAVNFVDIGDGLCASIFISFLFNIIMLNGYDPNPITHSATLAVYPSAAFLLLNFPKARLFLGDFGSYLIGSLIFFFISIQIFQDGIDILDLFFIPLLLLPIPLLDLVKVICIRAYRKESPFIGSPDHLRHNLIRMGLGDRSILVVYLIANSVPSYIYYFYI